MNNKNNDELFTKKKQCHFCIEHFKEIDYKEAQLLRRFMSSYAKIAPRRRSGVCAKHQRKLSQAIKRGRFMALLPYINR